MQTLEARPTEYRGVTYRSKSEAMFARYLELAGSDNRNGGYDYEPKELRTGDYVPDFLYWYLFRPHPIGLWRVAAHVIEYKPSEPTESYVEGFKSRCEHIQDITKEKMLWVPFFSIFYGSIWNKDRGIVSVDPSGSMVRNDKINWIGEFEREIKNTRFDLLRHF